MKRALYLLSMAILSFSDLEVVVPQKVEAMVKGESSIAVEREVLQEFLRGTRELNGDREKEVAAELVGVLRLPPDTKVRIFDLKSLIDGWEKDIRMRDISLRSAKNQGCYTEFVNAFLSDSPFSLFAEMLCFAEECSPDEPESIKFPQYAARLNPEVKSWIADRLLSPGIEKDRVVAFIFSLIRFRAAPSVAFIKGSENHSWYHPYSYKIMLSENEEPACTTIKTSSPTEIPGLWKTTNKHAVEHELMHFVDPLSHSPLSCDETSRLAPMLIPKISESTDITTEQYFKDPTKVLLNILFRVLPELKERPDIELIERCLESLKQNFDGRLDFFHCARGKSDFRLTSEFWQILGLRLMRVDDHLELIVNGLSDFELSLRSGNPIISTHLYNQYREEDEFYDRLFRDGRYIPPFGVYTSFNLPIRIG